MVRRCIEYVRAGEVFQILPGQRFQVDTDADPLDVYRVLRTLNPSPYMYFVDFPARRGSPARDPRSRISTS